MNTTTQTKWKMPHWMEKYIPMLESSKSKNYIEETINEIDDLEPNDYEIKGKVKLLQQLHDKRLI